MAPLQSERFRHQIFARGLTRVFLPNEKVYMSLDQHVNTEATTKNTPLVIIGEVQTTVCGSGSGSGGGSGAGVGVWFTNTSQEWSW